MRRPGHVLLEVGVDDADPVAGEPVGAATDFRRKTTVATISGGRVAKTIRASCTSMTSSATRMPKKVSRLTTAVTRPVWRKLDSASTSVVMRVMIRPVSSRS